VIAGFLNHQPQKPQTDLSETTHVLQVAKLWGETYGPFPNQFTAKMETQDHQDLETETLKSTLQREVDDCQVGMNIKINLKPPPGLLKKNRWTSPFP